MQRVSGCWNVTMAQMGFFDLSDRYASLDAKRDPLVEIDIVVPWEEFRPTLERVWRKPEAERRSRAGRKPMNAVVMFKTLVLGALYNLSDDQIEYQVRDRLSFMRFLGLGLEDRVPDAKTVWHSRGAGAGGHGGGAVPAVRRLSCAAGLYRARRADPRRLHRAGAERLPSSESISQRTSCRCMALRRTAASCSERSCYGRSLSVSLPVADRTDRPFKASFISYKTITSAAENVRPWSPSLRQTSC